MHGAVLIRDSRPATSRATLATLLLSGFIAAACGAQSDACELRVAWDPYEPYSYSNGGSLPVGYDIDVVTKVSQSRGCNLTFKELAWSDVLAALRSGDVDIAIGTGYKTDRAEWSWYSESYRKEVIGLMLRAGTAGEFPGSNLDEVFQHGLIFGKTTDDTYDPSTESIFANYEVQIRHRVGEEQNLRRLVDGSVDGVLIELNVAAALANRLKLSDQFEFHPLAFDAGEYRLQMSKKSVTVERVAQINAAIQQLAESGWLENSIEAYGFQAGAVSR